jgi:uncharacterized protein (DUF885 family)
MGHMIRMGLAGFLMLTIGCSHKRPHFAGETETERLHSFFAWAYQQDLEASPMRMAYLGLDKKQDQLDDISYEHGLQQLERAQNQLGILKSFNRNQLDPKDQLSYDIFAWQLESRIQQWPWRDYSYSVNQMFGAQATLPGFMMNIHQVKSTQDLDNYISRLQAFRRFFDQLTNNLMRSETQGVVPPRFVFNKVITDCENIINGAPFTDGGEDSPLWSDFKTKLNALNLSESQKALYTERAQKTLLSSVGPAYRDLKDFLQQQKMRASTDDGVWKFPKGQEYYKHQLAQATTLEMSPEQIHQTGLSEVKRIHQEMDQLRKKMGFQGDLKSFFKYMKGNKYHLPNSPQGRKQYMDQAKTYIKNMEKRLDEFFGHKPKAPMVVKAVEPFREKSAGMAFYQTPSLDGSRPGTYYVNLSNMKALPTWAAEALAYHEGIPGHHMQLTIAQELEGLPEFRRLARSTAYIEGWGLYSEYFPKEFGFYKDPKSDFGRLSMELMRSTRLVVDTGIHWKRWTREQAIAYLDDHLPGDHQDNIRQIERYIVMPGQATAYKVGQLKILELRQLAQEQLGDKFRIKDFHDVILGQGGMPLPLLEQQVRGWIDSEKAPAQSQALEQSDFQDARKL